MIMNSKLSANSAQHTQEIEVPALIPRHPSVSEKAYDLLNGVIEVLMREPKLYNQMNPTRYSCGAPCCIVGHMMITLGRSYYSMDEAPALCGMDKDQLFRIYCHHYWPVQFQTENRCVVAPATAIARIEHFLRHGE